MEILLELILMILGFLAFAKIGNLIFNELS